MERKSHALFIDLAYFIPFPAPSPRRPPWPPYSDLPMNFLLVKLSHHLLGRPSPPSSNTRASSRTASSWRTWDMYWRRSSASCLSRGASYIWARHRQYHGGRTGSFQEGAAYLVQGPPRVAGDGKVGVQRQVHDILPRAPRVGARLDLAQAVADEPDAVHEQAVRGALDLKVAEEGVGAEQRQHLVEYVVRVAVRVGRLVGGERRGGRREGVGGAAGLGAQGEEGEVAY